MILGFKWQRTLFISQALTAWSCISNFPVIPVFTHQFQRLSHRCCMPSSHSRVSSRSSRSAFCTRSVSCDTRDNDSRLLRARAPAFAPRDWSLVYLDHAIFTQTVKNISGQFIHTLRIRSIYHMFCGFRVVPLPGFTISNLVSVQENESW